MPIDKNADNIQVMVRVRPLNSREREEDTKPCIKVDEDIPGSLTLDTKSEVKKFYFDWVGVENTTQQTIFRTVGEPMVAACLEGFNCCIFAYGQTGAGKTFTMQGKGLEADNSDQQSRGLQPRVFDYIFKRIKEEMAANRNVEYFVSSTYLEIYNEQIKDLLDPIVGASLQIREDLKKGVYVEGLKEEAVQNSDQTLDLLRKGARNRHVGSTNMNSESSRSHSVFSMTIESRKSLDGGTNLRSSKFHFVDLAGSERQKQTAATGDRLKEAGNINKSLTVLGKVINNLVANAQGKNVHVAYRESKLTFLLKDSLGGNSKTCIIANVSPASSAFGETLSTLKFAQNAKQIKNKASINEDSLGGVEQLKNEIKRLKEELLAAQNAITSLKKEGTQRSLSPNLTPQTICFSEKQIYAENQRALKVEEALREGIKVLTDNEIALQTELAKKEEYVRVFQSAEEFYIQSEMQYKTIINLQYERNTRITKLLETSFCSVDINTHLQAENVLLKQENHVFVQIFRSMPLIKATFIKNISLQELLDEKEGEANPNSSLSVAVQFQESAFFLETLNSKLDESIKDRKALSEKIEKVTGGRGIKSPSKEKREKEEAEQQIAQIKQQLGAQIDSLTVQISNLNKKEAQTEKLLALEKDKSNKLAGDYEKVVAEKNKMQKMHKEHTESLIRSFESAKSETADQTEKKFNEQKIRNLELNSKIQDLGHELEQSRAKLSKFENQIKFLQADKQNLEENLRKEIEGSLQENHRLQKIIKEEDDKINSLTSQLAITREENKNFMEQIEELLAENNAYTLAFTDYMRKMEELRAEHDELQNKSSEEFELKERELQKQKERAEIAEIDRKKIQEELETVTQTLEYNNTQLEEKKEFLARLSNQNSQYLSHIEDLKSQISHRERINEALEIKITQLTNDVNSSFHSALRDNKEMQSKLEDLKAKLEIECAKSAKQAIEINRCKQALAEKEKSEADYKIAYSEMVENLQKIDSEVKSKEMEMKNKMFELQDLENQLRDAKEQYHTECSQANTKIVKMEAEIKVLLKNLNEVNLKNESVEENFKKRECDLKAQLNQQVKEKEALLVDLESMKQVYAEECELLSRRLTEQEKKYSQTITGLNEASKELALGLERSNNWFQIASKKHFESIKNIQGEIDGLEDLQIATEKRGEVAHEQLQQLRYLVEAARAELNLKKEQLEALQSVSRDSQEFILDQTKKISTLNEELSQEQKKNAELIEKYSQLEVNLGSELKTQLQLKEQIANLEHKNQQLEETLQEEKKNAISSQEEVTLLKTQLEEQISKFQTEFNEFKTTVAQKAGEEIQSRDERISKLENHLKDKEVELEADKEKLKQMIELEKLSEENQGLKSKLRTKKRQLRVLISIWLRASKL